MKYLPLVTNAFVAAALLLGVGPQASVQPGVTGLKAGAGTSSGTVAPLALILNSSYRIDAVQVEGGAPDDLAYVPAGQASFLSPIDNIASINIPNDASLIGFEIYSQVVYSDPVGFPADPVKTSQLLRTRLGDPDLGIPLTPGTGLSITLEKPARLGSVYQLLCTILP